MIHRFIYGSNVIIAYVRRKTDEKATKMQTQCSRKSTTLKEGQPKDNDCINIFGCTSSLKAITWRKKGKKIDAWGGKKDVDQDLGGKKAL